MKTRYLDFYPGRLVVCRYLDKNGAWRNMFPSCPFGLPNEERYGLPYAVDRARDLGFVVRVEVLQ